MPSVESSPGPAADGTHYPCSVLGECSFPFLAGGAHHCPVCGEKVHNLCLQKLTGVEDEPELGFLCGGVNCRKKMSAEEKRHALQIGGKPSEGTERGNVSSGVCSAGDNCSAKPGETSALSTTCVHGQPRHFVCARVPCPDDCGTTPVVEKKQDEVRQEVVDVYLGDGSGGRGDGAGAGAQKTSDQKDTTESTAADKIAAGPLSSRSSTPKTRRVPAKSRGTPTTPASPEPMATVGEYKAIKAAVSDSITATFSSAEFKTELAKVVGGSATRSQAMKAVTNAIQDHSEEFIEAAKQAGMLAVTKHLDVPLKASRAMLAASSAETTKAEQALLNDWKSVAGEWKLKTAVAVAAVAAAEAPTPGTKTGTRNSKKNGKNGSRGTKADTQGSDEDESRDDLAAAAKSGAAAVSKKLQTFVREEFAKQSDLLTAACKVQLAEQSVELKAASTAGSTEQSSELKAASDAQLKQHFDLWTTSSVNRITEQSKLLQDAFRVQVEEQTELLQAKFQAQVTEAVAKLSEQVACVCHHLNQQILTGIHQIDRSISAGQKRDSRDENATPPKQPDGRRRSPKRHQATRLRDEAGGMMGTSPGMGQGDLVMFATAMGQGIAQGNANRHGMAQSAANSSIGGPGSFGAGQFGTGVAAIGAGFSSQGMASHGIAVGVPSQGVGGHAQGVPAHPGPYIQAYGQVQGPQGNGLPSYLYR